MIKIRIEGEGSDIVKILQALQGLDARGSTGVEPTAPVPALAATPAGAPFPAPPEEPADQKTVERGMSAFSDLMQAWAVNFGPDVAPDAQPDRPKLLDRSMKDFSAILAFIHYCGGLTRAVRTIAPHKWDKRFCRLLAENLVSVSSAMGVGAYSDALEYTPEFVGDL